MRHCAGSVLLLEAGAETERPASHPQQEREFEAVLVYWKRHVDRPAERGLLAGGKPEEPVA